MPVKLVAEDESVNADTGVLEAVYVLTYTVPNHPGQFTVTVPKNDAALAAAEAEILKLTDTVNGLYAIT